ncbi:MULTISPECIES: S-layer homology domain-containing protein [Lysinibacillus]|uniref:S-layer homology domain-containing protein n=1 Tax=Lysinibacillus TaxID=400634 RepID=UPI0021759225|nr:MULTISPECIES: S-layer homology domain-containing protein [Lysinibacillus]MCS5502908.1 S-layer homology domain-containing protein [Lysinibacillus sp. A4]MCT1541703.1 S-layer homology domain-containing protein [Lysinibacillus capsici]MCT1572941.1 S-layer homology domain-containing protein [Lysinibacillus capsici]MCT1648046.1 S-layer homology domain-containing protein [Lysinibacillus capsici]MCT1726588.1 S-layer homology domain-containing protein [Lysinibacillus capsici]
MKNILKLVCLILITIGILPKEVQAASFIDLTDDTLTTEIHYLVEQDIAKGYSTNLFKPNDFITKAQVAVMLTRALGLNTIHVQNPNYQDVTTTHKFYKEIAAVQNKGIFDTAHKFHPDAPLTRGEMAIVLNRAFQLKGSDPYYFTDVSKQTPGYKEILTLAHNHLVRGYENGSFKPNDPVTRAHFSAFLARAMTLSKPNLLRDPAFEYTYAYYSLSDNKRYTLNYQYQQHDGKNDVWTVKNVSTGQTISDELLYGHDRAYGQAIASEANTHYDLYIELPLRIGVVLHEDDPGVSAGERVTVKSTDGTVQAGDVQYTGVVIVEKRSEFSDVVKTYYFVDDIGLVKELHNDIVVFELLNRTMK